MRAIWVLSLLFSFGYADKIVDIPEASGIDYCSSSDTLVVANDEGWYYEITTDGKIVSKTRVKKYDLEGVVCGDDHFLFAVEDKGLLKVNRATKKMKLIAIEQKYNGKKIKLLDKKSGIEGIAKVDDIYYLSKQSKKRKKSFIVAIKIKNAKAKIVDVIKHKIADTAGLTYHQGSLYMVSDKGNILIEYNLDKQKIVSKTKLSKSHQEGITFDTKGFFYIADDGGSILKYSKELLSNHK
jgi:uncharacterized protein YjiK